LPCWYRPPRKKLRVLSSLAAVSLGLGGCASIERYVAESSTTVNCITGGLLGAATGALAGAAAKGDKATIIGVAAAGGVAGCVAALSYKNRLERLVHIAREEKLAMQAETLRLAGQTNQTPQEVGLAVQVQDQGMFPTGVATPSAEGARQIRQLASAFTDLADGPSGKQALLVVGHTDATGSAQHNQQLSEARARAVADLLAEQGIRRDRMYFQGAGASRPIADNADPATRGQNRRVEIVLVDDLATLTRRVQAERHNPKYLAHGTATTPARSATPVNQALRTEPSPGQSTPSARPPETSPVKTVTTAKTPTPRAPLVDFGGQPGGGWTLAQWLTPKRGGFALIASAHASEPVTGCAEDTPRVSGEVKNLASGNTLTTPATRDYLPGMNGRAWAGLANGHLVTLSPVAVLRDEATVAQHPKVYITRDYRRNPGKTSHTLTAHANTWEGEDAILYRVFVDQPGQQPLRCLDVVLPKAGDRSLGANLVYAQGSQTYSAPLTLLRN